jgi:hypothetical protein
MLNSRTISNAGRHALALIGALLLGSGIGWGQNTPGTEVSATDPFAGYHSSLSKAADKALASPPPLPPAQPQPTPAGEPIKPPKNEGSVAKALTRVQQLRAVIDPILLEERIPTEMTAIVLVESGGQPAALSPKGARGIWQLMPETARRYGLVVSSVRDERMDIPKSTHAAARYLRYLYSQFGDWELAFAAYNAGEGVVQQAIDRNQVNDFASLSNGRLLPLETRRYVPAVINAMQRMGNAGAFVAAPRDASGKWILYLQTHMETDQGEVLRTGKEN